MLLEVSRLASVMVMGAGAVGSYYGALLARAGHDVMLIARGEHLTELERSGRVTVREPDGNTWSAPVRAFRLRSTRRSKGDNT